MTIKFPCPHCKKMLSVKEHLAGKKAACPACKAPMTIPTTSAPPAAPAPDLEALAAATFTEEPVKKEAAPPQFVEFQCFYCDEKVKVNAELAGKQAPCPECRRIVKVPQLVKEKPKDWRTVDMRGPLIAQTNEPAPEGAWGSTTSKGHVSRQSLEDAAALPATAAPSSAKRWLLRGGLAVVVLLVGLGGWWGIGSWTRTRLETQLISKVEAFLRDDTTLPPELAGELERAAGEYHLRALKAELGRVRFTNARSRVGKDELTSWERDFVLADLAAHQVELGGTPKEEEDGHRLKWETALKETVQTLVRIRHASVRQDAVREATRRLIARGEGKRAPTLAAQVGSADEVPDLLAIVGLELLAAKMTQEAGLTADLAWQRHLEPLPGEAVEPVVPPGDAPVPAKPAAAAKRAAPTAALIALFVALDKQDPNHKFPPPPPSGVGLVPLVPVGYVEGLAYRGQPERAREFVKTAITEGQVQALVALADASVALDQKETARAAVEQALQILEKELRGQEKRVPMMTLLRLVRIGAQVGLTDPLKPAAAMIADKELRSRAQLAILHGRLTASRDRVEESRVQDVDPESPLQSHAWMALARHNARVDSPRAVRNSVDGWESEKLRPFGWIGVALGSCESRR